MGGAYYDSGDLGGTKLWLQGLAAAARPHGIMCTTPRKDYTQLAGCGDLLSLR